MRTRTFVGIGLLVALFLAGFVSYYASSHPDGLEYVAERTGFLGAAEEHDAAGSPLADYTTDGVDDPRVSGGLAGVIGAGVVLLLAGGLAFVVRRRGGATEPPDAENLDAAERSAGAGRS